MESASAERMLGSIKLNTEKVEDVGCLTTKLAMEWEENWLILFIE